MITILTFLTVDCYLLLSDTILKDDSFRTGRPTMDSSICDCGMERETAIIFY